MTCQSRRLISKPHPLKHDTSIAISYHGLEKSHYLSLRYNRACILKPRSKLAVGETNNVGLVDLGILRDSTNINKPLSCVAWCADIFLSRLGCRQQVNARRSTCFGFARTCLSGYKDDRHRQSSSRYDAWRQRAKFGKVATVPCKPAFLLD